MSNQTITLTLKADASGMVKVVGSAVDGVKTKLAQAGSATDAWKRQLGQIGNVAKAGFAALAAGAAAAGAGMALMVRNSINAADAIAEASERTGVAVEQLSKLDYAAKLSGTSFESVEKALTKLSREADAGGANLARLGVSAVDSSGKMRPVNDLFLEVSDRFSEMGSAAEKSAAAQAIFGKAGAELVPMLSRGRDGLAELGDEAERLGIVISGDTAAAAGDFKDNLDKLSAAGNGLANSLTASLMPTLLDLSARAVEYGQSLVAAERESGAFETAVEKMAIGLKVGLVALALVKNALDAFVTTVIGAVDIVATSFGAIGRIIGTVATSIRDALAAAFDMDAAGVRDAIGGVGAKIEGILNETTSRIAASGSAIKTEWSDSIGDVTNTIDTLFSKYEEGADASDKLTTATNTVTTATRSLGASTKVAAEAEKQRAEALKNLQSGMEKLASITQDYERQLAGPVQQAMMDAAAAHLEIERVAQAATGALEVLGGTVEQHNDIRAAEARALDLATMAHERNIRAAEVEQANRVQYASAIDAGVAAMAEETRQMQLSHTERAIEAALIAATAQAQLDYVDGTRDAMSLRADEIAQIRDRVAAEMLVQDQVAASQRAAADYERTWTSGIDSVATAFGDWIVGGIKSFSDFGKSLKDIARQTIADIIAQFVRSGLLRMLGGLLGGGVSGAALAAGSGGQQSMLGAMLGGGGGAGGGLLSALFGGSTSASMGIPQINVIPTAAGGVRAAGSGSMFGGGMMANGMSMGGMLGAGGGILMGLQGIRNGSPLQGAAGGAMAGMSIAGPWGALVGAIVGGLGALIRGKKEPDFRLGGSDASIRNREGSFETVFGRIQAGSRQLSWESLVQPMQQFDQAISDMVQTIGGGQPQIDAITATLARWEVDLKGSAATAENILGSRFAAILTTFSADVQGFVGSTGTVQERVARLTDALAIENIVDAGALGDSFAEVSSLLTEYRVGTEAIADTYSRVLGSVTLLDEALALSGASLDLTRAEMIRFATDIVDAAGGLQRAQALWSAYFEMFYSADERAAYALQQARSNAATQLGDIGLDLSGFGGDGAAQAFREMFERVLPTLSAEAVVEWLEAAEALGVVIQLTGQAGDAIEGYGSSLADLMQSVKEQLGAFAGPQSFADRMSAATAETDALIERATALGATEQQIAAIRELGALRLSEILDEQAQAVANYQDIVRGVRDQLDDARGLSEFGREMREINRGLADTIRAMDEAARAAGMQGAAESDLAAAHERAAIRAAQAMARLQQRGRDLVQQLYGSQLDQLNAQIAAIGDDVTGVTSSWSAGMQQVTAATDNAVQAQIGAQQRIRDWLDNLMLGDLGGLRPRDALVEAQALFDRTLASALGGDAEAMAALPGLADQLLRLGQRVYASGAPYFDLRDTIRAALQQVASVPIEVSLPPPEMGGGGSMGGGSYGGYGADQSALIAERDRLIAEQAAAERRALAQELAGVIRDLVIATGVPLDEIAATLGVSMSALVADLGANIADLTVATASQLADIAQAMGVELSALATSVGVDLGNLADAQSLLNDALEREIAALPEGQRAALESLLRDVEEAAALGDTAGVERGIGDMEAAINEMAPSIRDALAPYFLGIRPADPTTEIGHLSNMDANILGLLNEAASQTAYLAMIAAGSSGVPQPGGGLGAPGPIPPPSFAVGTGYVPRDGLAMIHRGEAIFPAPVAEFFRREGIPMPGTNNAELVAELRELRRERREADEYTRRMEQRIAQLETTTARGNDAAVRAVDRQTDVLKSGSAGRPMIRGF